MDIELAREHMIEQQIRPWNVSDPHVLELLGAVKREDFLPAALKALAFADLELPITPNRRLLTPAVEAKLVQEANVQRHERVLQVGVGSGYVTALLAHRAQHVLALESDPELARLAQTYLAQAGIVNVAIEQVNGAPAATGALFDVIVLTGSVAKAPQALLNLLKPAGRMVAIIGDEPMMYGTVVTRQDNGGFAFVQKWDTVAARLPGFAEPSSFSF